MLPRLNNKFYIFKKTCFSFKCSMIALSEKYIVRKVVQSLITDFNTILTTRILFKFHWSIDNFYI